VTESRTRHKSPEGRQYRCLHSCGSSLVLASCMRFVVPLVALAATTLVVSASSRAVGSEQPLIGATFTHTSLVGCDLNRTGIVLHDDSPGVRHLVQSQLAAMHAAGLQTIRILLWNMTDITSQDWGVLPRPVGSWSSRTGRI